MKTNEGDLTQSHAKQFKQSPIKVEDDFEGFGDPYFLSGKDANRAYKDIVYNTFKTNGFRDIRGWIPLTKTNRTTEVMPSAEDYGIGGTDGLYHRGDSIVAWMPKERYIAMRKKISGLVVSQTERAMKGGEAADIGNKLRVNGKSNLTIEGD